MYVTKSGDMFDLVAFRQLGSCDYTEKLLNVNRTKLRTLKFKAGEKLNLPDVSQDKISKLPPWLK
ncbi:MAG: phage tail protein [Selenomonadaceae bacterium]|nr:phage tail protein [Selenomonadaceae bacterium]